MFPKNYTEKGFLLILLTAKTEVVNASLDNLYQAYLKLSILKQFSDCVGSWGERVTASGTNNNCGRELFNCLHRNNI